MVALILGEYIPPSYCQIIKLMLSIDFSSITSGDNTCTPQSEDNSLVCFTNKNLILLVYLWQYMRATLLYRCPIYHGILQINDQRIKEAYLKGIITFRLGRYQDKSYLFNVRLDIYFPYLPIVAFMQLELFNEA